MGRSFATTFVRAGTYAGKYAETTSSTAAMSRTSFTNTVRRTTSESAWPMPHAMASMLSRHCAAWSCTPPSTSSPVSGSTGSCAEKLL